ncbi:MAG: orotidine-5'-phosphate decarboxylase [Firmicutes bacterium]|nr:orotidine-5'-phosphate decarboxylase [Bacillota bacterium]
MIVDKIIERADQMRNPSVIGIDTSFDYLPEEMKSGVGTLKDAARAVYEFNKAVIDAAADIAPAVKVQIAYYEAYGPAGVETFAKTCEYAKSRGMFVIADCKRNDIGATAAAYAQAYLSGAVINGKRLEAFYCDMLTVNAYLGADGVEPFVKDCAAFEKGIFVLCKTSNPSGGQLQDLEAEGVAIYNRIGALIEAWGENSRGAYGYSRVGAVVGATHPAQAAELRQRLPHTLFLVPGYGAQGAGAADIKVCFDHNGRGALVNSSRAILLAYKQPKYVGKHYAEAARAACIDMRKEISEAVYG